MSGRPRKPTALLEATGAFVIHPERRKQRKHEPHITGGVVKPHYLRGKASGIWDEVAPQLVAAGILTTTGARTFATWCCLEAEWERSPQRMNASRIAQKIRIGQAFGMDAASQARLSIKECENSSDPADKYFR